MKYENPTVVATGTAIGSIKGQQIVKEVDTDVDNQFQPDIYADTLSAYEADE